MANTLLISAPRLGVLFLVVDSVCVSVCLSICLSQCSFKLLLLFCLSMESSRFLAVSSPCGTLQNCFLLDFRFRPPNPQNLLPKICSCTKSPLSRLVCQIDRRCLHLPWGFRGWPIQWNHAKCCGADPCCNGNDIWPRRGDQVAYRLVYIFSHQIAWIHKKQHLH